MLKVCGTGLRAAMRVPSTCSLGATIPCHCSAEPSRAVIITIMDQMQAPRRTPVGETIPSVLVFDSP